MQVVEIHNRAKEKAWGGFLLVFLFQVLVLAHAVAVMPSLIKGAQPQMCRNATGKNSTR